MSTSKPSDLKDATLFCPHDHARMEKVNVGGVMVDRCNACGRLWLDDGEMKRLLAHQSTVEEADAGPFGRDSAREALGGRVCPRDKTTLLEFKHPERKDVIIEFCPGCRGVLLDAGELRHISGHEASSWLKKVQSLVRW